MMIAEDFSVLYSKWNVTLQSRARADLEQDNIDSEWNGVEKDDDHDCR